MQPQAESRQTESAELHVEEIVAAGLEGCQSSGLPLSPRGYGIWRNHAEWFPNDGGEARKYPSRQSRRWPHYYRQIDVKARSTGDQKSSVAPALKCTAHRKTTTGQLPAITTFVQSVLSPSATYFAIIENMIIA
jgi:hypothetical protein